jgi:hypothetical protein
MTKADDYRHSAAETMQLARRVASSEDKGRLLKLAERWMDLADRARRVAYRRRSPNETHPLVREKLDRHAGE